MLSRESILAVKPRVKLVAVPEWGGKFISAPHACRAAKLGDLGSSTRKAPWWTA